MTRTLKPLKAGDAFDRIRIAIDDSLEEAETAAGKVRARIPARVLAIASRVADPVERVLLKELAKNLSFVPAELFPGPIIDADFPEMNEEDDAPASE